MANFNVKKDWYVVDATNLILGRMSTEIAKKLTGKDKVSYVPHEDHGDYIIVVNAEKIKLTGNKINQKKYYKHSGYPGGLKVTTAASLMKNKPEELVKKAVWGMVPHNRLGRKQIKKLFVYAGLEHQHQAQNPKELKLK